MKKQKSQTKQQLEVAEKVQKKLAAIEKEMAVLARQQERRDQAIKKGPNFFLIALALAGVLTLRVLAHYFKHHNDYWFQVILSAVFAVSGSGYLVYCLKTKRTIAGNTRYDTLFAPGLWVYRDEDPFTYWLYMAFLLLFSGIMFYVLFRLLINGSI